LYIFCYVHASEGLRRIAAQGHNEGRGRKPTLLVFDVNIHKNLTTSEHKVGPLNVATTVRFQHHPKGNSVEFPSLSFEKQIAIIASERSCAFEAMFLSRVSSLKELGEAFLTKGLTDLWIADASDNYESRRAVRDVMEALSEKYALTEIISTSESEQRDAKQSENEQADEVQKVTEHSTKWVAPATETTDTIFHRSCETVPTETGVWLFLRKHLNRSLVDFVKSMVLNFKDGPTTPLLHKEITVPRSTEVSLAHNNADE